MKKIILTLAGFCFLFFDVEGQEVEWQNTIGGGNSDYLYSIKQTHDGGYIIGGMSTSYLSGDKTENSLGFYDYWLIKIDSVGIIQWQNTIGGSSRDELHSVEETSDNGYILGGWSESFISGDKTEGNMGFTNTSDYWIIKTDSIGNIQWQNTIGGNGDDVLYTIQQTNDNGYILGGFSNSGITGDKSESSIGGTSEMDFWIVKTDNNGNIEWQNTIGGDSADYIYSMQQTSDGGYICGGFSRSNISGDKTENNLDTNLWTHDYWILKLDSVGNIQWQNTIGGTTEDRLTSVAQTFDGGFICGGYSGSDSSGDKTENNNGGYDYWVVKLDPGGNIQWQNTIGGNYDEFLNYISQTSDGGYVCGGTSNSIISGDKTENRIGNGNNDFWVLKLDGAGNIQWQNTIGGDDHDQPSTVLQTSDGAFICGGWSASNISGDKTENCMPYNDYWVVKLTNKYNFIAGNLFADLNSNNIQDGNEPSLQNRSVTESITNRFAFSQPNGLYSVSVLDTGNFTVTLSPINYFNTVPVSHNASFTGINQIDSLNDFAFQPTGVFNDLCVTITPMGNFRAGMNASYMINYENVGTTTLNATVIFFPDNDVTFVSSNVIPTSVTTDSVVWNVGTLTPFQTGSILVTVNINLGTANGTLINSSVEIDPVVGDANTSCNYDAYEVFVTGAVDPNAILVDRDTVLTTELSSPPYLNYIIYFQNTGNDTAFNLKVLNPIDTFKLQLNTLEFIASSHPVNMNWIPWERNMEFTFDNILLPDSIVNEPASHGFIRYMIKPKSTLVAGDQIKNNAAIYFDFNAPVLTDTAVTKIVLPTGEEDFKVQSLKFKVYPNPVRDELIVNSNSLTGKKAEIKIYDLYGREVFQLETLNFKLQTKINVSLFSQGVYFVELQSGEKVLRGKFLKE